MEFGASTYAGVGQRIPLRELVPSPRHAAAVWLRNARVFSKLWKGALWPQFLDPLFYLVALGFGLGTYVATVNGISYKEFIGPGLIASAAMWAASFECTYNVYLRMNETRLYDNILATPVEVQDLVAGDLAWSSSRSALYGTSFLIIVTIFGLVSSPWAILIPPLVFLGGLCFSVIAYTFTALIPKIDLYSYFFTLFITPMFLFSGIFFPLEKLPDALEVVAWFTPLYHLVNLMRELATGPELWIVLGNGTWLAVLTLVLFPLPVIKMRQRLIA
jgi:lipooligosaccharide transport system permease protein